MYTVTDLFCGCGGSATGAKAVPGVHVKYALNHWPLAIKSHNTNHPTTHHDCADTSDVHPGRYQRTNILIASPECTEHSLAKGKKRTNLNQSELFQNKAIDLSAIRSRATMWDVVRFTEQHKYEGVIVENVVDVRRWAPYQGWLLAMHALGYLHKEVYLNAMFAHDLTGRSFAPQSRDRIYVVFWKKGNRAPDLNIRPKAPCPRCQTVVEAVQLWKPDRSQGKYNKQYVYACPVCLMRPRNMGTKQAKMGLDVIVTPYYYAALNAIDLSIPLIRIGDRHLHGKKDLSPKTRQRIEYGIRKFGPKPLLLDQRNQHGSHDARLRLAEGDPLNCQSTGYSSYLFSPFLFDSAHSGSSHGGHIRPVDGVFPTQTTQQSTNVVSLEPFLLANRDCSPAKALTDVIHTQTTANQEILLSGQPFLSVQSRNHTGSPVDGPLPTITTLRNTVGLVVPIHGTARPRSVVQDGMDTVMTSGHSSLVLMPYHGTLNASRATDPLTTVPTRDSISLADVSPSMLVDDCYFRMLQPSETAAAQGFPPDYVILGNKEDQQKQIGNGNPPPTMQLLVERLVQSLT